VIVPGGGDFADQVRASQRKWKFDDRTAHRMALLAMQQYALLLASFSPEFVPAGSPAEIGAVLRGNRVAVWMPDVRELDREGIPAAWDITSDSLSAWLARKLRADRLVLVKSAPQRALSAGPEELVRRGVLDPAFPEIWKQSGVALRIYPGRAYRTFAIELDALLNSD
jgi:aspartokinase-like uncharacterized kinase